MTTKHLRLEQVFSKSHDYIFHITKNMRFYSWDKEEVESLFADIVDACESSSKSKDGDSYELNQIIALRDSYNEREIWEVADGQQRLVTLCLLLCALRDSLSLIHI